MGKIIKWSDHPEYVEFMKDYIPGHVWDETVKAFYEKFGVTLTRSQIKNLCNRFNVRSGITNAGCFKKGSIPHNKGKKMSAETYRKVKGTMFKKGNIPKNHREVGSERITVDGYVEIKVAAPNKWKLKSRVLYEQYHNITLKSTDVIIYMTYIQCSILGIDAIVVQGDTLKEPYVKGYSPKRILRTPKHMGAF